MSQMKGAIFAMAVFVGVVIPFFLMMGIGSLHQHAFLKTTTELSELVKEEGGVSEKVNQVVDQLGDRGYSISFSKTGIVEFGEEIAIYYHYEYKGVRGVEELNTSNTVTIAKRNSG
ncbi:hypothetical protein H7992_05015 [Sporosarcina sp. resist]|uniref:hypothetical protein n=1 Tax=Sporosarcina sp. resist TaxID=2762563 RepID=UPI00164CFC44|nr:hypothetical protein [Sporosarcina sp. resist]QNK89089.1 hypothetical protein H7992_05015 [Sporosarcina sp. resist]